MSTSLAQALREAKLDALVVLPARLHVLAQQAQDYKESIPSLPVDKVTCHDLQSTWSHYSERFKEAKSLYEHEKELQKHPKLKSSLETQLKTTQEAINTFQGMWKSHCDKMEKKSAASDTRGEDESSGATEEESSETNVSSKASEEASASEETSASEEVGTEETSDTSSGDQPEETETENE